MADDSVTVRFATDVPPPVEQRVVRSRFDFEATVARLRTAIAETDLFVLHEIDPQAILARSGFSIREARQLLFFHPRYMVRLLALDPSAIVEVPLKLVVLRMPDGSVTVRHTRVEALVARHPALEPLVRELTGIYEQLLATVAE